MPATYAESRANLIDAFIPKAKRFAELIRNRHLQSYSQGHTNIKRYHPTKMDFSYIRDDFPIHHAEFTNAEIPGGSEGIKIWFNPWCFVAFYDIRPRGGGGNVKVTREPAVLLRKVPKGAQKVTGTNNSDQEQPLEKEFEIVSGKGGARDIGAKASVSLSTTVKAGSEAYGVEVTTQISAAVESSVNDNSWYSETLADKTSWPGKMPPHSKVTVSRLFQVGRYQQKVTVDGELDYSVYVLSRGDFDVPFDSRDELAAVLSGVGNTGKPGNGHFQDWARAYSRWPLDNKDWWIDEIAGPVVARYVDYDEADNASDEEFSVDIEPLG